MKILGYTYKVEKKGTVDENDSWGRSHIQNQVIQLATDLSIEAEYSTVIHEIIEALNYYLELELDHKIITILDSTLTQVLCDSGVDLTPLLKET